MIARPLSCWPAGRARHGTALPLRIVLGCAMAMATAMATAACAGQRQDRDAAIAPHARPRAVDAHPDASGDATAVTSTATLARVGDVEVRVRWPGVPAALLRSGPFAAARACGEPSPQGVHVDAEFGVHGVFVVAPEIAATATTATANPTEARILLDACDPSPSAAMAAIGDLLLYNQGAAREVSVAFSPWSLPPARGELRYKTKAAEGELMVMALREPGVYRVTTATSPQPAIVVVPATPHAGLTDERGLVTLRGLPVGEHRIVAWLPGASDEATQLASGTVIITPGKTTALALQLGAP